MTAVVNNERVRRGLARPGRPALLLIFPLVFLADLAYGTMDYLGIRAPISPPLAVRSLILLMAGVHVFHHLRRLPLGLVLWSLSLVLSALPGMVMGRLLDSPLGLDVYSLVRALYGPVILLFLLSLRRRGSIRREEIIGAMELSAYVIGVALMFSAATGIRRFTYKAVEVGSTGLFYAQNDLTLALGLALLAAVVRVINAPTWWRVVLILVAVIGGLDIGTRASIVVLTAAGLSGLGLVVWRRRSGRTAGRRFAPFMVALGVLGAVVMGLHSQLATPYLQAKLEDLAAGNLPRAELQETGLRHLEARSGMATVMGEGMSAWRLGVALERGEVGQHYRFTEVDWLDLTGAFGPLFPLLLYGYYALVLLRCGARFLLGNRDPLDGTIAAALALYLGHSALAGHALSSPMPAALAAGFAALSYGEGQRAPRVAPTAGRPGDIDKATFPS